MISSPDTIEISVAQAAALLAQRPDLPLIDVREEFEREICALPGSRRLTQELAEEMIGQWDRDQEILFMCHHGGRSRAAAEYFQMQGFTRVKNLTGGIDAWAREIDQSVARY